MSTQFNSFLLRNGFFPPGIADRPLVPDSITYISNNGVAPVVECLPNEISMTVGETPVVVVDGVNGVTMNDDLRVNGDSEALQVRGTSLVVSGTSTLQSVGATSVSASGNVSGATVSATTFSGGAVNLSGAMNSGTVNSGTVNAGTVNCVTTNSEEIYSTFGTGLVASKLVNASTSVTTPTVVAPTLTTAVPTLMSIDSTHTDSGLMLTSAGSQMTTVQNTRASGGGLRVSTNSGSMRLSCGNPISMVFEMTQSNTIMPRRMVMQMTGLSGTQAANVAYTYSASDMQGAFFTRTVCSVNTTDTLPTSLDIHNYYGGTMFSSGFNVYRAVSYLFNPVHTGGAVVTLAAPAGVTVNGVSSVALTTNKLHTITTIHTRSAVAASSTVQYFVN